MNSILTKVIRYGLLMMLMFTSLAFGTVEAWSIALFEISVLGLVVLWCVREAGRGELTVRIPGAAWPIAALLLLAALESASVSARLSMDVEATRSTALMLFSILVCFILAANSFEGERCLLGLANFFAVYGCAIAVFSLIQHFTWNGKFYWIRPNTQSASPFGPFPHHGHFAGYIELLMVVPLGLVISRGVRRELRLFYGFAVVIMAWAHLASLSRGGMLGLGAAVLFLVVTVSIQHRIARRSIVNRRIQSVTLKRQTETTLADSPRVRVPDSVLSLGGNVASVSAVVVILGAIALGTIWLSPGPLLDRVSGASSSGATTETLASNRGWIWRDTVSMIRANPILGVGVGAFETAYPIYSRSDGSLMVSQAHNDYLQVLADSGVIGGALAIWFIVATFVSIAAAIKSRDRLMRGLALGSGAGIVAMLVHSAFDFNLQIPSNALLFLVLVGMAHNVSLVSRSTAIETAGLSQPVR